MWEGIGERRELQHIDPHSIGHNCISFPFSWAAQPGAWGPLCWVLAFLPHLVSNWSGLQTFNQGSQGAFCRVLAYSTASSLQTNWLPVFTELYNSSTPTFFFGVSQLHSFNPSTVKVIILIFLDRMHLLFTEVHFLFWQPGRVVGQYTTAYHRARYGYDEITFLKAKVRTIIS